MAGVTESDLSRELENLREQQRALGDVLRAVAQSAGLQPVLDEVVEAATRLCEGDNGRLWLLQDGLLHAVANGGVSEGFDYDRQHPHVLDQTTMSGRAALARRPVHLPDVLDDPTYAYSGPRPFRANLSVPILFEDDLIGVIGLVRRAPEPFTEQQIRLVQAFADQAAIAIKNARLIDAVERQLEQQRAVSDVLGVVARSEGLGSVFNAVVEAAARLCEAEYGQVHVAEGDLFRLAGDYGAAAEIREFERQHPNRIDRTTVVGRVALTRDVVHLPDALADPDYSWPGQQMAGYRAMLGVPIFVNDELIGVINVVRNEPKPFSDEHIELVKTFADQAAIAIADARLIETVERQLDQQQAISDVLRAVARSEGLESVFHELVEVTTRLCDAEYGEVLLLEGDRLRLAVGHGGAPELYEYEHAHPHPLDRSTVAGRVALSRDVVHIPDIRADPDYHYEGPVERIRAGLGAPILVEDELIGVFSVTRERPEPFSEDQIELLRTFSDHAAIAIANARLIDAVERQRTELSRFVSPQVAELVSSEEGEKMLGGHRAYISALFCDLRGFTAFAETAEPEELFEVLREYHSALGQLIPDYEGTLEHFAGDGLMVFFNDPLPVEQHELKAIRLALQAQERFSELASQWRKRGTELGLGIGISSGYATLGRIGFEGRYDYGALGPVTNLASRLSTQAEPGQTLISQRVFAAVEDAVEAEMVGEVELKGFGRPIVAYEVRRVVESGA